MEGQMKDIFCICVMSINFVCCFIFKGRYPLREMCGGMVYGFYVTVRTIETLPYRR